MTRMALHGVVSPEFQASIPRGGPGRSCRRWARASNPGPTSEIEVGRVPTFDFSAVGFLIEDKTLKAGFDGFVRHRVVTLDVWARNSSERSGGRTRNLEKVLAVLVEDEHVLRIQVRLQRLPLD